MTQLHIQLSTSIFNKGRVSLQLKIIKKSRKNTITTEYARVDGLLFRKQSHEVLFSISKRSYTVKVYTPFKPSKRRACCKHY